MSQQDLRSAQRPEPDQAMVDIANYVTDYYIGSSEAYTTARYMLLDSLACAMLAMRHPECVKHLGPIVPGAGLPGGAPGRAGARLQYPPPDPPPRMRSASAPACRGPCRRPRPDAAGTTAPIRPTRDGRGERA